MVYSAQSLWSRLKGFPTPIGGLALGIGSIGILLDSQLNADGLIQTFTALIAAALLGTLAVRFATMPDTLLNDLKHPVVGSVAPTFAMGTMIVSNALVHLLPWAGYTLWLLAIGLHIVFLITFIRHRLVEWKLHQMVPSWFIPPVGIAVAAVSYAGPHSGLLYGVALGCMIFAALFYAVMLPLMFFRLIFEDTIPEGSQPTIAILAAPPSLCLAGYLSVIDTPNALPILILYGIALMMTAVVYAAFVRLLFLPFSPGFAAFTFPMAIGATAQFKVATQVEAWGARPRVVNEILFVGWLEMILATLIISYVALRYAMYFLQSNETAAG